MLFRSYMKLILTISVLALMTIVVLYFSHSIKKNIAGVIDTYHTNVAMTINGYIEHDVDEKVKYLDTFFDNKNILNYIENKERDNFHTAILPFYNKYKSIDSSLWGMHIILKDGMSFIRVHSPNTPDTKVSQKKALVQKAIQSQKIQVGFEVRKYGYFYRIVYPLFLDNKFIGISEFSYNVEDKIGRASCRERV